MDNKKIEYVKLVFYEDKKDYDKSWGEVYYKLIYGDNQVHRTYKEKITKKEYPLCLRAFRLQEGTNALPFEKYQIYDAKTKKPLNMPYYLKEKTKSEVVIDKIKSGLEKTATIIDNGKYKIDAYKRREPKEVDKSLLYSIRGGISDIKGNNRKVTPMYSRKENRRKMMVKITSIATATVLLGALGNYELKKNKIYYSDMMYITNMSNKTNYLDKEIKEDYIKFENIMNNLLNNNYENISDDDIDFINQYVYLISKASNDSLSEGNFYEFNYLEYLDKQSPDYQFFLFYSISYENILEKNTYKKDKAYDFCARGCNLLYYTIGALSTNKSAYMPTKNDIYNFNGMKSLSKIIFLSQLKGLIYASNFSYHKGDEPYWWVGLNMNTDEILNKIDEMIEMCKENLKYDINNNKGKVV